MNDAFTVRAADAYAYPLLIKQLWAAPLVNSPDQEIVYRELHRYRYRDCYARMGQLAGALDTLGVGQGDTVAMMEWDSHRYLEAFYAVPMMGAVLQTVNLRLSPEQVLYTLNHARPSVLVMHEDFLGLWEHIRGRVTSVRQLVWISDTGQAPPDLPGMAGDYETLLAAQPTRYLFPDFDENTRATTFYTTGTTGDPKGVYFSHRQLVLHTLGGMALLATGAEGQRFHRGDVYMPMTPLFHVHAWGVPLMALAMGVKQVYPGRYLPERLVGLIRDEGVTFSHCVPTILQMLLACPDAQQVDLSRWKCLIGGSALSTGLARSALSRGIDLFSGYGMSETCPLLTVAQLRPSLGELDEDTALHWRTSAGMAAPLVQLRVVDANGQSVEDGDGSRTGEVQVRAPWLTQGYLGNPDASADLWAGGWLHTQDVGYLEQGYLRITDRVKDVIKSGGEWISSVQLEDLLSRHPAVAEAAAFAVPSARWGETPAAVVVLRPGTEADADSLRAHLQQFADSGVISRYAVPQRIEIVDAIAKTSVGKLDKKRLRQTFAGLGAGS